jgi:hypothetical protein
MATGPAQCRQRGRSQRDAGTGMGAWCGDEDGRRGARPVRYVSGGGVAVRGERWRHPWGPGSGAWGGARGSGDWALARRCSDDEGRWVAARGDQRGGGWWRPWGPGSGVWGGARGSGDRGLAQRCSDGEGQCVGIRGVAGGGVGEGGLAADGMRTAATAASRQRRVWVSVVARECMGRPGKEGAGPGLREKCRLGFKMNF